MTEVLVSSTVLILALAALRLLLRGKIDPRLQYALWLLAALRLLLPVPRKTAAPRSPRPKRPLRSLRPRQRRRYRRRKNFRSGRF